MFEALRADPCRFVETLFNPRSLYRLWRSWRLRGTSSILAELSTEKYRNPLPLQSVAASPECTSTKAALLVIDATIPQYDRDAGGRSSFLYLQILSEMGYEVFFMPNDQLRREPYASILEGLGVKLLMGPGLRCGQWKHWLRDRAGQITHVVLHRPNVARRYLAALKKMTDLKILYFAHDLRFLRETRHYELNGDVFHRSEAKYWEKIEKNIVSQVDRAYFFSGDEAKLVSAWNGEAAVRTVPLFPVHIAPAYGFSYAQRAGLLFVGGFAHQPNLDAVLWFATEVFPLVRQALPDIEWHIVGREPPPEIRHLAGNGIVVHGVVSEERLKILYQTTRLAVAPLRFGAGVKGKVVEAMCQGVPVITTQVGAEGIPDGNEVLKISTSVEDMARQILETYQHPELWENMRERAIQGAHKYFSRRAAMLHLSEDLDSASHRVYIDKRLKRDQ